ncbi:MAG: FAD-dependent oxidoreductase [Burkholderiales bacterium]
MESPASRSPRRFAVIGSGASGCYAIEALLRQDPLIQVDVIERMPTPFGLIRYGVAPDHQGTKAVMRTLERFLANERVRYFGSVTVGRDISLDEVVALYDGIIIATGVNRDRKLGLPGGELRGVMGSGVFASWYNDHPEAVDLSELLAGTRRAVVIGAGNVALDVTRQLVKRPHDYAGTDMSPAVEHVLSNAPLDTITVVGRCGPAHTKFSPHEFKELARVAAGRMSVDPQARPSAGQADGPLPGLLREILALPDTADEIQPARQTQESRREVRLRFGLEPVAFLPAADAPDRVGAVRLQVTSAHPDAGVRSLEQVTLPADLVVTCVGYDFHDRFGLGASGGVLHHVDGRIKERLYVVGWAKRGPSGTIGTNRVDSHTVVAKACAEVPASAGSSGAVPTGIEPVLRARGLAWIDFAGWKQIDRTEIGNAARGRVRRKLNSRAEQLAVGLPAAA